MTKNWRLILDGKCDGYYNMAVDEALFRNYSLQKNPTLRIYGWQKPFISLGYNQNSEQVLVEETAVPFVRRITGGSAIFHDKELTYSISCALKDLDLPKGVKKSYKIVCSFLKVFYAKLDLEANFATDIFSHNLGNYNNFCFASSQHFDLVVDSKKIGGNAQRRSKDIIFQHGSIPQRIDFAKVEQSIKNIENIGQAAIDLDSALGKITDFNQLIMLLAESFKQTFGVELIKGELSKKEKQMANYLRDKKYICERWNLNRKIILVS